MQANIIPPSSHPLNSSYLTFKKPSISTTQHFLFPASVVRVRLSPIHASGPASSNGESSNSNNGAETKTDATSTATGQPQQPVNTLNIRYRSRSRKKARQEQQQQQQQQQGAKARPPPKDWESMTLGEKAIELYVGEKGLLFWLNKFAYASIFIIIGGWILFRFVGPSVGLYQLDAPPLSPTNILKGSS